MPPSPPPRPPTPPAVAVTLARTVGPFLLASNLWSAYRAFSRRRRRRRYAKQEPHHNINGGQPQANDTVATLKTLAERCGRFAAFVAGLHLLSTKMKAKRGGLLSTFAAAACLHRLTQPFDWNLSLYFSLRALGLLWTRRPKSSSRISSSSTITTTPLFLTAPAIYFVHCAHNFLVAQRADWVSPFYLKLWQQVLPVQYPRTELWVRDFGSKRSKEKYYPPNLCGPRRLRDIPRRMLLSLRRQLPMVAATFALPVLLFKSKVLLRDPVLVLLQLAVKCIRSSVVLTALPFLLTEFPCVYGLLTGAPEDATPRADVLHTATVSLATTGVFLAEPRNRLRMIVVYTHWRVFQTLLARAVPGGLRFDGDTELERIVGACLTGLTACISAL